MLKANCEEPDQTTHSVEFDLWLHYFHNFQQKSTVLVLVNGKLELQHMFSVKLLAHYGHKRFIWDFFEILNNI